MRLHYFPESGNCYKVALMLSLSGIAWDGVFVDYFDGETRTPQWRQQVNEMGEVPVLEHDGLRLTQSGAILQYLAELTKRFAGRNSDEQREAVRWMLYDNHKLSSYLATYRYLRCFSTGDPAVIQFLKGRIETCLSVLEQHLESRPYVASNGPTIADFSMVGLLYYPKEEIGYDLAASHPNISSWLSRIANLPGWKTPYQLMPGARFRPST